MSGSEMSGGACPDPGHLPFSFDLHDHHHDVGDEDECDKNSEEHQCDEHLAISPGALMQSVETADAGWHGLCLFGAQGERCRNHHCEEHDAGEDQNWHCSLSISLFKRTSSKKVAFTMDKY
jgi:hypothetical protein